MILIINIHKFNSKYYKNLFFYKFIISFLKISFVILLFNSMKNLIIIFIFIYKSKYIL